MKDYEALSPGLSPVLYEDLVRQTLKEDLGRGGDLTTRILFPERRQGRAVIRARQDGVAAGLAVALAGFFYLDRDMEFQTLVCDGDPVKAGETLVTLTGDIRALLTAERTGLNFLGHLGGIARETRTLVDLVAGTGAKIADTRKTLPGLRALQKYAVRCGGGFNHRLGLDDAVMIKDNHIAAAGGLAQALEKIRREVGHTVKIEVEVDNLDQLEELLALGTADIVLIDNLRGSDLEKAVALCQGKILTEASGGITRDSIRSIAETGVNVISSGALTHSVKNWDVGLDWEVLK